MKKKIVIIIGARPQFIKMMPLMQNIKGKFDVRVIHTGQHYDYMMSRIFFKELNIPLPDRNLNVGSGSQGMQTAKMLERIEKILLEYKSEMVVVLGDTNSTLAGTLAAAKLNIPIAHIEAGLRSFKLSMPEEINRIVSDHLSRLLFCPTPNAVKLLKREGIKGRIVMTGDIMCDALKMTAPLCAKRKSLLERLGVEDKDYYLLTLHRDFNTDRAEGLKSLLNNLKRLNKTVLFPVHPRTKKAIHSYGLSKMLKNLSRVIVVKPQGYIDFLTLQLHAAAILTDSGGVQKEAYMLKIPCVTLRDETEWIETLKGNANRLAGRYGRRLAKEVAMLKKGQYWKKNVFGDGKASKKIVKELNRFLNRG